MSTFALSGASISWWTVVFSVFNNSLFYFSYLSFMKDEMSMKLTTWHSLPSIIKSLRFNITVFSSFSERVLSSVVFIVNYSNF